MCSFSDFNDNENPDRVPDIIPVLKAFTIKLPSWFPGVIVFLDMIFHKNIPEKVSKIVRCINIGNSRLLWTKNTSHKIITVNHHRYPVPTNKYITSLF